MPATQSRINDFVIKIATVNGTGSASANGLLMKALFRMGIPVTGKNLFPSNIQGLPTWYEVRANRDGYISRSGRVDVMVAMNAQTYERDMREVTPGGFLIYDSTWPRRAVEVREDITVLGVPLAAMCNERFKASRVRILMKNIAYVGVLSALMGIDRSILQALLEETFATKPKLVESNLEAIDIGYQYALENFTCPLPVRAQTMGDNAGKILIDGNAAAALGCLYAGATVGAWYPITPSTSLMDAFKGYCQQFRRDPENGRNNYCIVQAEDELAAAGIVLGASWCGARAFTPTSGPGISLMSEFIGFAYYAEIPSVFFDVQRVGPSTGMPTRTQQCDILLCAYASHGDTRHPLLLPSDPAECFEMAVHAFDMAERLQTPIFVLSDLDVGMNDWMIPELAWDDSYRPDRGKVLGPADLDELEKFYRYLDRDGDGIPYRTYPGEDARGAYFVRGSGHNRFGGYTEDGEEYRDVLDRLLVKWDTARGLVPEPVLQAAAEKTSVGLIAFGSSDGAVTEALDELAEEGIDVDYLRIRGFPFNSEVQAFLDGHETVFVVEQNRDAQMRSLLLMETQACSTKLIPILHYNGMPIPSDCVVQGVASNLGNRKKEAAA
ncbi:MAG: 2-oxoacid:acceptor oxidoreductase subunit alpha [Xanthomonadales bacterium]|nr:2-oxoacid:acceptor oxidoreductase subunit alpha [Xanthomonadales bacterium]NIN58927.1 2-oxoacid:acceptor oxidoreductase subunit alpha [Xanthomonadales bacterium]NIN74196.1 2-oxoacid:acceptor oxidoreductase subunit alpha [Xanthomonadales bacterium]NIO13867.1 2-oxoacid:acceptor oxidoreductase subunit alpha [Xanthomonadales bacterium]NIP11320.1 2-oxoacid:acceptor oxidoreductase subunit alpha [Xanthomonadales bacterium]